MDVIGREKLKEEKMTDEVEIDLKKWIRILLRNWIWVLLITLIPGIIAFVLSVTGRKSYMATSLVAITKPQYIVNFDPRFETVQNGAQNYGAYQELATSDELLISLMNEWKDNSGDYSTLEDIREILKVSSAGDPSLLELSVTLPDPHKAADLANLWTRLFVDRAQETYGGKNLSQVEFFKNELITSKQTLESAEQAIIDFQSENELQILTNQLNSKLQAQSEYLTRKRNIEYLAQDIRAIRQALEDQAGETPTALTDQIAYVYLQMRAFNTQPANSQANDTLQSSPAIQLQVTAPNEINTMTQAQQMAFLTQLDQVIQSKSKDLDSQLEKINPEILELQKQVQEMKIQQDRLTRTRDVAQETYITIARKVDETKITTGDTNGTARIAANAVVPDVPVSRHLLRNTALGIAAGLFIGVAGVLITSWWKETPKEGLLPELTQ